ncbi:MAG: hypothetical protein AAF610_00560 [Pseudomonadota bacterium]
MSQKCISFLLLKGIAGAMFLSPAALATDFDPSLHKRIELQVDEADLSISYFGQYDTSKTTFHNQTDTPVRFVTYSGPVAGIRKGDVFSVPCEGSEAAGYLEIEAEDAGKVSVFEAPLCGDLVLIKRALK